MLIRTIPPYEKMHPVSQEGVTDRSDADNISREDTLGAPGMTVLINGRLNELATLEQVCWAFS